HLGQRCDRRVRRGAGRYWLNGAEPALWHPGCSTAGGLCLAAASEQLRSSDQSLPRRTRLHRQVTVRAAGPDELRRTGCSCARGKGTAAHSVPATVLSAASALSPNLNCDSTAVGFTA